MDHTSWVVSLTCLNVAKYVSNAYMVPLSFSQVSIKEGRHFWLDLKGITVPPQSPMLYAPTGERCPLGSTPLE